MKDLKPTKLLGTIEVDPAKQDFFKTVIEERKGLSSRPNLASEEISRLDKALKVLVKASLYHRYPGGKEEMVDAVLSQVDREFLEVVLKPAQETGHPEKRARQIASRLREFYHSGNRWCLLDTLTVSSSARVLAHARRSMKFWVDSFARIAKESGMSRARARRQAENAVAAIEGGLIVSRVMNNPQPFLRVLATLPQRLTRADEHGLGGETKGSRRDR